MTEAERRYLFDRFCVIHKGKKFKNLMAFKDFFQKEFGVDISENTLKSWCYKKNVKFWLNQTEKKEQFLKWLINQNHKDKNAIDLAKLYEKDTGINVKPETVYSRAKSIGIKVSFQNLYKSNPESNKERKKRECMKCHNMFLSEHKFNRICPKCKITNSELRNVNMYRLI